MAQLGVSAPDPQTVRFELERPTPYFPRILTSNATVPVPRHAIEANGRNWTKAGTMVSNGAFTLTEWVPNTRIAIRKNPRFFDAANVKLDGVNYFPTDNTDTPVNPIGRAACRENACKYVMISVVRVPLKKK